MRAALFEEPGSIVVDEVPTPTVTTPTSAVVRITHTAICGTEARGGPALFLPAWAVARRAPVRSGGRVLRP